MPSHLTLPTTLSGSVTYLRCIYLLSLFEQMNRDNNNNSFIAYSRFTKATGYIYI